MVEYLLFDLDSTLYAPSCPLAGIIEDRMTSFVAEYLGLSRTEASSARREQAAPYGTTIQWLVEEHALSDHEGYFASVYPDDVSPFVKPDESLADALARCSLPMSVLTNSPIEHARRVVQYLGIDQHFDYIFDIRFNRFRGKPHTWAFRRVLRVLSKHPEEVLLIDDSPGYVKAFARMGGNVLLVQSPNRPNGSASGIPTIRSVSDVPHLLWSSPC
jgi:putative hydrolase of the HAD superfamily